MKRILALVGILCLILGFQNCTQQGEQSGVMASSEVSIGLSDNTSGKVTYVEIPNVDLAEPQSQKSSYNQTDLRLVISVDSGSINLTDLNNDVQETRCLSVEHLKELRAILSGASVCENQEQIPDDIMCTQVMQLPYASLYVDKSRVKLGEAFDGCGRGRKDLCGEMKSLFQAYISFVKQHWSEMNCQ